MRKRRTRQGEELTVEDLCNQVVRDLQEVLVGSGLPPGGSAHVLRLA